MAEGSREFQQEEIAQLERQLQEKRAALISHAVTKGAMLTGERELVGGMYKAETITTRDPSAAELYVARAALAAVPGGAHRLAYARVDLVPGLDGNPLIIELELTEPSLFLGTGQRSAERFADVLERLAA